MNTSRHLPLLLLSACLLLAVCSAKSFGQTATNDAPIAAVVVPDDIKQALATLGAGDAKNAIKALKAITKTRPDDGDAWHSLGVAYRSKGDRGGARKAFRRAFELRSDSALKGLYVPASAIDKDTPRLARERSERIASILEAAASSLDALIAIDPKSARKFAGQLGNFRAFVDDFRGGKMTELVSVVYRMSDVDEKAVVTHKPEATFTDEARANNISGTITMRIILASDGKVRFPVLVNTLGYGLDQQALRAALGIKFTPARKDGRPVSQYAMIRYSFNVY